RSPLRQARPTALTVLLSPSSTRGLRALDQKALQSSSATSGDQRVRHRERSGCEVVGDDWPRCRRVHGLTTEVDRDRGELTLCTVATRPDCQGRLSRCTGPSESSPTREVPDMPGSVAPVADEREGLLAFLAQQRHVLRISAHGLTDEQARATPVASTLS